MKTESELVKPPLTSLSCGAVQHQEKTLLRLSAVDFPLCSAAAVAPGLAGTYSCSTAAAGQAAADDCPQLSPAVIRHLLLFFQISDS